MMLKLTDTQLIMLSNAAAREDGIAQVPERMSKAAALKAGASLVTRKLMREVRHKAGMPAWGEDEKGKPTALVITRAGRDAIENGNATVQQLNVTSKKQPESHALESSPVPASSPTSDSAKSKEPQPGQEPSQEFGRQGGRPREGSKQALILGMLQQDEGATLAALMEVTGWLSHTTRAALTGLRKRGYQIERQGRGGSEPSLYKVTARAA